MASCGAMIEGNVVSFSCSLDKDHDGPHMAYENERSVRARKKWDDEQGAKSHAESGLAQFQGRAETTAQRYTENPTAVPGTRPSVETSEILTDGDGRRYRVEDGRLIPIDTPESTEPQVEGLPESPVVLTEHDDGSSEFRTASTAEAKVAGVEPSSQMPDLQTVHLMDLSGLDDVASVFAPNPAPSTADMVVNSYVGGMEMNGIRMGFLDLGPSSPEYDFSISAFYRYQIPAPSPQPEPEHSLLDLGCKMRAHGRYADSDPEVRCMVCRPTEPTKQRPGDQSLPTPTGGVFVQDRIIGKIDTLVEQGRMEHEDAKRIVSAMQESKAVGTERYGTPLQTFNGRDTLQDAVDEARDLFVYLSAMQQAREADRVTLVNVVAQEIRAADGNHTLGAAALAEVAVDAILNSTGGIQT